MDYSFHSLLKDGANYFSSEDHEYWNNAPFMTLTAALNTATAEGRREWMDLARRLYDVFQGGPPLEFFAVGALSFCKADTRMYRTENRQRFMRDHDLARIGQWIQELEGPGVLVVGQPILSAKTSVLGNVTDWGLADFRQYDELLLYLKQARHSLLILTGDVHFARVAVCRIGIAPEPQLVEIIASPMARLKVEGPLAAFAGGGWKPAHKALGDFDLQREKELRENANHFLTVEFSAKSPTRTHVAVRFWPTEARPSGLPPGTIAWQGDLQ